jgi:outer membrane protein OmpA-like peptidoglycan-associated protein
VQGAAGPTGKTGPVGDIGPVGARGPTGVVPCWVSYREFWFNANSADILSAQDSVIRDMASYLKKNPTLIVGLDGHMDSHNKDLSNNRVNAIRDALIDAGVPANRIKTGAFGDSKLRRDGRVEVLIMSGNR